MKSENSQSMFYRRQLETKDALIRSPPRRITFDHDIITAELSDLSPTSSIDEVAAAAALVSLPSFGSDSVTVSPPTSRHIRVASFPEHPSSSSSLSFPLDAHLVPSSCLEENSTFQRKFSSSTSTSAGDDANSDIDLQSPTSLGIAQGMSLSLPEDEDFLSPLHCFMRRYCVEAFSATADDVNVPRYGKSHGRNVRVGQVGIRCLHCRHLAASCRPPRAVCYPSSLHNIYHSIETWQRRHSAMCSHIPGWIKRQMADLLHASGSRQGGRRRYWEVSAKKIGLMDTPQGVCFAGRLDDLEVDGCSEAMTLDTEESSTSVVPLVSPQDKHLVSDYLYMLMEQMELCYFTEEDRVGGRSKVKSCPVGFPGMQCVHCRGKAGLGRYFPLSVSAIALANSDRNMYNHLEKCRRCPKHIQHELKRLRIKSAQGSSSQAKRGSRKQFFSRVWERMHFHGDKDQNQIVQQDKANVEVSHSRKH